MIQIEASILSADFGRLGEQAREAEMAGADAIQIDVMDGRFVPDITFGAGVVRAVRPYVTVPLDVHLMIVEPERHVTSFVEAGADRLIVVDAVKGGAPPGSIYRFDINDAPSTPAELKTSVHQIGILEVIHLSELVGDKPEATIIGVEPKSLEMGMELSPELEEKLPKIIELVLEEINRP